MRGDECMKKLRYGYTLMWREVPAEMKRYKCGEVDSFDYQNGHFGVCWGWPRECRLTDSQAEGIYLAMWKKRSLTLDQMVVVRKAFAYAFELAGGTPGGNYPSVKAIWKLVRSKELAAAKGRVIPQRIPTVKNLRAFGKPWSTASPLSLIKFCSGEICAHDSFITGLRSTEDVDRVKKADHHEHDWKNGWQCTSFKGGRAKLCGKKKGTRPWAVWTVCYCKRRHKGPPDDFWKQIKKDGNPRDPDKVDWCTNCPLSCLQLLWQLQEKPRRYGKWLDSGRFGKSNIKDPVKCGIDWLVAQGECTQETRFDRNSGRKCCARWTRKVNLDYEPIFQMVGDLEEVWRQNYDPDLPKSDFKGRKQSTEPKIAAYAQRVFAKAILKSGRKLKPVLNQHDRLSYALLKSREGREAADRALFGDWSSDESDEE